jgi:hypothetical protein
MGRERCWVLPFQLIIVFYTSWGFGLAISFLKTDPLRHFFSALAFGLLSRVSILFGHD